MPDKIVHETKEQHVWEPIRGMEQYPQRICVCGAFWAPGGMQSGANTISFTSSGGSDYFQITGTAPTLAPNQFGIASSTGRRLGFCLGTAGAAVMTKGMRGIEEPSTYKTATWGANAAATSIHNIGTANTFTVEGTAASSSMVNGGWGIQYTTAAVLNSDGGWLAAAFNDVRGEFSSEAYFAIRTGATITNVRYFIGCFSGDPMGSATPAVSGVAFRYDTVADGTAFWRCYSAAGGAPQLTTTTYPVFASSIYNFKIQMQGSTIRFFSSAEGIATHSTTVPANATSMGPVAQVRTLDAVAKVITISAISVTNGQITV
jgi:hypothetical protein